MDSHGLDILSDNPSRELIFEFRGRMVAALESGDRLPVECPLIHTFSAGMYCRSIFIPSGSELVGKTHRHRHLLIMSQGHVIMTGNNGLQHFRGFNVFESVAGIKRVVKAVEDTIITTVHLNPGDSEDLEVIEADVIVPDTLQIGETP